MLMGRLYFPGLQSLRSTLAMICRLFQLLKEHLAFLQIAISPSVCSHFVRGISLRFRYSMLADIEDSSVTVSVPCDKAQSISEIAERPSELKV